MKLEIHLQPEWRSRLLNHLPERTTVHAALESAVEILGGVDTPDEFVVTCNETEVPALRQAANEHCTRAVEFIDFAAERSRLYRSNRA
jgi:hypothetical protein